MTNQADENPRPDDKKPLPAGLMSIPARELTVQTLRKAVAVSNAEIEAADTPIGPKP